MQLSDHLDVNFKSCNIDLVRVRDASAIPVAMSLSSDLLGIGGLFTRVYELSSLSYVVTRFSGRSNRPERTFASQARFLRTNKYAIVRLWATTLKIAESLS